MNVFTKNGALSLLFPCFLDLSEFCRKEEIDMNSKELKASRIRLFRDAANFKKTDRIPHFANVVTW